jgi:arginyl-tRNA synthetase
MGENLFDNLDGIAVREDGGALWSARAPFRPEDGFDLMLVPRVPEWREDTDALAALDRIEAEPWVEAIQRDEDAPRLRLDNSWIERTGAAVESGEAAGSDADIAAGNRYAVYFWGANTTKALHIGHLRNLALGNAIGASLSQAGARVEHRSLICDVGRSMGEAMAGVVNSGRDQQVGLDGTEKADHFVGTCYADYVKAGRAQNGDADGAEDSVARESAMYDDKADQLMRRVLAGDQSALELWSKTRAWVISGQRKTLARLGITFDKVIFESDFLPEVAELTAQGLAEGTLTRRRGDEMVMYQTQRAELEEMPLVRSDGLPTQHMRALAYWSAAPELEDVISLQVCGTEWVSHVTCRRKLIDHLGLVNGNSYFSAKGGGPPTHDVFHGMVARENTSITSSKEGALLIDDLAEWLEEEIESDPESAEVRRGHPHPDRLAAQVALGYFLLQPTTKRVEFEPEKLLRVEKDSLGWDLARAQAHRGAAAPAGRPAEDADYRFAVVQSEMYRRHLRSAVESFDAVALARYLAHFARWYRAGERAPEVDRVVQAVLDRGIRGLGLEGA